MQFSSFHTGTRAPTWGQRRLTTSVMRLCNDAGQLNTCDYGDVSNAERNGGGVFVIWNFEMFCKIRIQIVVRKVRAEMNGYRLYVIVESPKTLNEIIN